MKWKDIEGYEGRYQVSDTGLIKSLPRIRITPFGSYMYKGKILKLQTNIQGYLVVSLENDELRKLTMHVHRIVAKAFIANPDSKAEVNHKNGVKDDNRVSNLEWTTRLENQRHAEQNGYISRLRGKALSVSHVGEYRPVNMKSKANKFIRRFECLGDAMRFLKESVSESVGDANVILACKHQHRTAYGYKWEYADQKGVSTIPKGSSPVIDTPDEAHNDQNGRRDSQVA